VYWQGIKGNSGGVGKGGGGVGGDMRGEAVMTLDILTLVDFILWIYTMYYFSDKKIPNLVGVALLKKTPEVTRHEPEGAVCKGFLAEMRVGPLAGTGSLGGPGTRALHSPKDRGDWPNRSSIMLVLCGYN
jgi:hypothetical protein